MPGRCQLASDDSGSGHLIPPRCNPVSSTQGRAPARESRFVVCSKAQLLGERGVGLAVPGADLPADFVQSAHVEVRAEPAVGRGGAGLQGGGEGHLPVGGLSLLGQFGRGAPEFAQERGQLFLPERFPRQPQFGGHAATLADEFLVFFEHGPGETGGPDDPALGHGREALGLAGRLVLGEPGKISEVFGAAGGRVGEFAGVVEGRLGLIPGRSALRLHQPAQAGPRVGRQVRDGPQLGPDGIEMDVVAERAEAAVGIHQQALVTALEEMAALAAHPVEPGREGALQPAHAVHEIGPGSGNCEVVVVRHETPSMDLPAGLLAGLAKTLEEGRLGLVGPEDVRPVIAPVQDMIDPGLGFHSQRSRHARQFNLTTPSVNYKLQSLTLYGSPSR